MSSGGTPLALKHPSPFSKKLMPIFASLLDDYTEGDIEVLDPFAGTGRVHQLARDAHGERKIHTTGVELLPGWAAWHSRTIVGDATDLPKRWTNRFDVVCTSPVYPNRMTDHHNANDKCSACKGSTYEGKVNKDGITINEGPNHQRIPIRFARACKKCEGTGLSPRRGYRFDYEASEGCDFFADADPEKNAGMMAWGPAYKELHIASVEEIARVLKKPNRRSRKKKGSLFLLNMKDSYVTKKGVQTLIPACDWWRRMVIAHGFERLKTINVDLYGMRRGANHAARTGYERVYVFRKV